MAKRKDEKNEEQQMTDAEAQARHGARMAKEDTPPSWPNTAYGSASDVTRAAIESTLSDGVPMPLGARCRVINESAAAFFFEGVLSAAANEHNEFVVQVDRLSTGQEISFTGRFPAAAGWTVHSPA